MIRNRCLQRISDHLRARPEAPFAFIRVDGRYREITWAGLAGRMGAYLEAWRAAGVQQGDIVFIILRHGIDPMPAFLAAMWMGAVPSFLPHPNPRQDPVLYRDSHAKVLRRTGARALLAEHDLAEDFRALLDPRSETAVFGPLPPACVAPLPPPAEAGEDAPALLQHSSGTTGLKKGVVLTYRAIAEQIDAYAPTLGLSDRSRIVTWLPLYHDMGLVACFLLPSLLGIPIVAMDPFEWVMQPHLLLDAIEEYRATHAWLPNFAFAHLARGAPPGRRHDLSSLVMLTGTSEPNRPETFDRFLARFGDCGIDASTLQTSYGMAEAVFAVCQSTRGVPPRRLGIRVEGAGIMPGERMLLSNGRLLPGVEMAVLHEGRLLRAERLAGELCVASPFNFSGYFGEEAAGPAGRFHRTGDIGFIDQGEVFVLGRIKDLIIVNGRNLYAHDIEAAVSSVRGIRPGRCVALGVESDRTGSEEIVILAEVSEPVPSVVADINRAVLAHFGLPAGAVELVPHGWLCKTTSGKVSREENLRKYLSEMRLVPEPGQ